MRLPTLLLSVILSASSFVACSSNASTIDASASSDARPSADSRIAVDAGRDAGTVDAGLTWYLTCGDVVCSAPLDGGLTTDGGVRCPPLGTACNVAGQGCGVSNPGIDCGATDVCDDHDPRTDNHGCPI